MMDPPPTSMKRLTEQIPFRSPTIVDKLVQRVDSFTRALSGEKQSHSKHLEKQKSSANGVSYLKLNGVIRQHEKRYSLLLLDCFF